MDDKEKKEKLEKAIQNLIDSFDLKEELVKWLMEDWEYQEKYAGAFIEIRSKKEGE